MGQSKKRKTEFLAEHPLCCFCGGETRSTEIDHMPPAAMFNRQHRPDGLLFPACSPCNRLSKDSEQVAAFVAVSKLCSDDSEESKHFRKLALAFRNNCGVAFDEMARNRSRTVILKKQLSKKFCEEVEVIQFGPTAIRHVELFGAKFGMAGFYECSKQPLPKSGGVAVKIHTSIDAIQGSLPSFPAEMGPLHIMKQGRFTSEGQFEYRFMLTDDGKAGVFQGLFHRNLLVTAFAFVDRAEAPHVLEGRWYIPGELKPVESNVRSQRIGYSFSSAPHVGPESE